MNSLKEEPQTSGYFFYVLRLLASFCCICSGVGVSVEIKREFLQCREKRACAGAQEGPGGTAGYSSLMHPGQTNKTEALRVTL